MLKAILQQKDGRRVLFLGIDATNVGRMMAGDPLFLDGEEFAAREGSDWPAGWDVVVHYGPTLAEILQEFRDRGVEIEAHQE